jgi:hypothetical protein
LDTSWHLPTGPYWAVAVAHGGQTIQTQRATFLVESPAVTLELTLSEQQLQLGEPLHASLIITNQDPITGTGKLELTAMTLDGEGLQMWFPELGPGESETYDYSFVPQVEAGYVLRTSVGNDMGTIARVDRGFSVGEAPAVALTGKTQPTYQPGDNVILPVTAVNAGTQSMTTTLLLNTYNRNNSFTLVYSTTQAITLDSGANSSLELMMLPLAIPGSYSTHLLLGDRLYSTYDYLVTAEGSLFTVVRSEPIAISGSEPVTLIVDVQNEVYAAIDADVSAELLTPTGEVINVPLSQISTGLYQVVYVPDSPGTYTVKVIASKPNYAGTSSTTFFTVDEASLLLVDTQGQLMLNQTSPITITIVNEKIIPVPDTSVLFTSINGILVGQTDGSGVMNLVLRPVTTDTIQVRVEKLGFASTLLSLPVVAITDTVAPALSMILPEFTNQVSLTFNGVTESNAMVTINDQAVLVTSNGTYTASVDLVEGANLISGVAIDPVGNRTVVTDIVTLETVAPGLTWTWPPDLLVTASPIVTVTGTTESDVGLMINNLVIDVQPDGSFSAWVLLDQAGANTITVMVADRAGNETQEERVVWLAVEHRIYLPLTTRDSP